MAQFKKMMNEKIEQMIEKKREEAKRNENRSIEMVTPTHNKNWHADSSINTPKIEEEIFFEDNSCSLDSKDELLVNT